MNKLIKLIKILKEVVKKPSLLNLVLEEPEIHKHYVSSKYGFNNGLPYIDLLEIFPDFNESVTHYALLDGGSLPVDIALLKSLAKKFPECSYLEIGTWRGESAANVATVAKKCVTVNLSASEMQAMGMDKEYIALHDFFSSKNDKIVHIKANSKEFDFASLNEKYDLIFIDGDHHYDGVLNDTKKAFQILKNQNSIIVWHDAGLTPSDTRWEVVRGIMDGTPEDKRKFLYRVKNTMCAVYYPQEFPAKYLENFPSPDKNFLISIKAEKI
jgi:predicted O-methyltransferase YrrM